jgi:hypothetical protein
MFCSLTIVADQIFIAQSAQLFSAHSGKSRNLFVARERLFGEQIVQKGDNAR